MNDPCSEWNAQSSRIFALLAGGKEFWTSHHFYLIHQFDFQFQKNHPRPHRNCYRIDGSTKRVCCSSSIQGLGQAEKKCSRRETDGELLHTPEADFSSRCLIPEGLAFLGSFFRVCLCAASTRGMSTWEGSPVS